MRPFYQHAGVTIYHGDALEVMPLLQADVMVSDVPYGIGYRSGHKGKLRRSIKGDADPSVRDAALKLWGGKPALVFGSWKVAKPAGTRMLLIWDTLGALGMGDTSLPWKPAHQEIYVLGSGFRGHRGSDVLAFAPVQSMASNGRVHPHQKPVELMMALIDKCPPGIVLDPFMGSGSTLVAAKQLGREAIGIELEESDCEIAARRLSQDCLPLVAA